jgi:hypothetical protein
MMIKNISRQGASALVLMGSFIVGSASFGIANAQTPREERSKSAPVEATGNVDRNKNGIDDRYEVKGQVDRNQNGVPDSQEGYSQNGRNRGHNGNKGYNNADFQHGYNDGLTRGREDSRTNRAMNPNNSSHYRNGNSSYRAGFEKGFNEGYHRNHGR